MSNIALLTDEHGIFIGQKDRNELEAGDIVAISSLLLENSRGELLIAQRSLAKRNDPGLWGPSAAGTLEPGETFLSNIIKEAEEEIGLAGLQPKETFRMHYWRKNDGVGRYGVCFHARTDWTLDKFKLQEEEVAAVRWMDKFQLLKEVSDHPENFVGSAERWQKMIEATSYN